MHIERNRMPYLGVMTWAQLSAVTGVPAGTQAMVSDWGQPFIFKSNGEWAPVGGSLNISIGGLLSLTGTVTPTTMFSVSIPGGLLGSSGSLVLDTTPTIAGNSGTTVISSQVAGAVSATQSVSFVGNIGVGYTHIMQNITAASQTHSGRFSRGNDDLLRATRFADRTANTSVTFLYELIATLGSTSATLVIPGYKLTLYK